MLESNTYTNPIGILKVQISDGTIVNKLAMSGASFKLGANGESIGTYSNDLELVGVLNFGWGYIKLN